MASAEVIGGIDLSGGAYRIEQGLVGNTYSIYDSGGELLLRADPRRFDSHRELPFRDTEGEEVFSVEANDFRDGYSVVPADGDRPVAILERDFSPLHHRWHVRHGRDEQLLATIEAQGPVIEFFRYYVPLMGILPHTYTIESADGSVIGELSRRFSVSDTYELALDRGVELPRTAVVLAAFALDALD